MNYYFVGADKTPDFNKAHAIRKRHEASVIRELKRDGVTVEYIVIGLTTTQPHARATIYQLSASEHAEANVSRMVNRK